MACGNPAEWTPAKPSWAQCDVTSYVAWEYLGGELVLGKVFLDGEETEHHYWNRVDGNDIDLTREQFTDGQEVREVEVLTSNFIRENSTSIRPELLDRIAILRTKVAERLSG